MSEDKQEVNGDCLKSAIYHQRRWLSSFVEFEENKEKLFSPLKNGV
jgi:hypothetical protein